MTDNPHGRRVFVMGEPARHRPPVLRDEEPPEDVQPCTFHFKKWKGQEGYLPGRCSLRCRHGAVVRTKDFPDEVAQMIARVENLSEDDYIVVPKARLPND